MFFVSLFIFWQYDDNSFEKVLLVTLNISSIRNSSHVLGCYAYNHNMYNFKTILKLN
jgi:hypothetical protein